MHVYERLGVKKVINAWGALTKMGGSLMEPEVLQAMSDAAGSFVDWNDLQEKAGAHVARLLSVEAAYISSGAAAGLTLSTAACVAGVDPARIRRLPDLAGMKNEVLVQRSHRNGYDHAVRAVGVTLVEYGLIKETYPWELENAITDRTAAIVHFVEFENYRNLPLSRVIAIAKNVGVPVIVDAAAEIPPVDNLTRFSRMGADLVVYSGGKDIRGPQSSGLILGRADLIRACAANGSPNYSIGRGMKVGKEEIAGLVVALERYLAQDWQAEIDAWERMVAVVIERLCGLPGVKAYRVAPGDPGIQPNWIARAYVDWDEGLVPLSPEAMVSRLMQGDPAVAVGVTGTGIFINPHVLLPGEEEIVAQRMQEVLTTR